MTGSRAPKVSVVTITYNHEAFIRDALDGFVSQKTDFPVEYIIADDASTDATPAIIAEYADRHPGLFRPVLRAGNVGIHANLTEALSATRGEYLAICEGDDYWTDPYKLSNQAAFMDSSPRTAVCFHPVRVHWTDGRAEDGEFPPLAWRKDFRLQTLISRNFIHTNSVMYRRLPRYDNIAADALPLDFYLHVMHAVSGEIAMLPDTMGVYRRHPQGLWYNAQADPPKFWAALGVGQVAMYDAFLDMVGDDPACTAAVAEAAGRMFGSILSAIPDERGEQLFQTAVARYPRLAAVVMRHQIRTGPGEPRESRLRRHLRRLPSGVKDLRHRFI